MSRFLLLSLSIETILAEPTIYRRKEKLKQISKGQDVGDVYTTTFERIKGQENARSRLGMEAIMWVAYSERLLKPDELCQALGVEVGSKDLKRDNAPTMQTIMNCTLGFITVDSSSSTVRLVHFTLQEYILAHPTLFQNPHSVIVEVCLTYLNFACIMDLSPNLSSPPPTAPFLKYASYHWGSHAQEEISESAIPLALRLLVKFDAHISCKLLLLYKGRDSLLDTRAYPIGFTGLHGGAFFGILEPMISSFDIKKWDLNATDPGGNTALAWAVRNGHDRDAKILLEQVGLHPDIADNDGLRPLAWASGYGFKEIVKMLLERKNVNLNAADKRGGTPLSWAASNGNNDIVEMLLQQNGLNPNTRDRDGRTPLSHAAEGGQAVVVKLLLERSDVNSDARDEMGRTPLLWASSQAHKGVVDLLLERSDVSPDTPDERGRTALAWAAVGWSYNPEELDMEGRTSLIEDNIASGSERAMVARLLLERSDVNPDRADNTGRTPLSWAASYGRGEMVKMLLERSDVTPDTPDEKGRTPFWWAVRYGNLEVMETLLESDNVDPDAADNSGQTPLSFATENWEVETMEILLKRNDVNLDRADKRGRTPLSWASSRGTKRSWKRYWREAMLIPTLEIRGGGHPFHGHLAKGTRKSWRCY